MHRGLEMNDESWSPRCHWPAFQLGNVEGSARQFWWTAQGRAGRKPGCVEPNLARAPWRDRREQDPIFHSRPSAPPKRDLAVTI